MKKIVLVILFAQIVQIGYSQTLKGTTSTTDSTTKADFAIVKVYADGNVKGLVSDLESNATSTTGALGISVEKLNCIWHGQINIASTIDTLKENFGSIILNPASGKNFTSGFLQLRINELWKWNNYNFGSHFYVSGSSSFWSYNDTVKLASVLGIAGLVTMEVIQGNPNDNVIYMGVEFGPTYRGIYGNISQDINTYEKMLGTRGTHFGGIEGGLIIQFNHITAGINIYWLFDLEKGVQVADVTSIQLTGGISISADVFKSKIPIKKNKKLHI